MKERRKPGIVISTNLLLSIISTLLLLYSGYVIKTVDNRMEKLENKIEKSYEFISLCQQKIMDVKEIVSAHLAWHNGKDNIKKKIINDNIKE